MDDLLGSLPANVSTFGGDIDRLYHLILYITAITFFIVQGLLVFFLWRYRAGASSRAHYTHGNTRLEVLWTAVPTVIVVMLGFMSKNLWAHIKRDVPPADITIRVTGKQFNWEILYPGPDGKFGTDDDYQVDNDMRVPVNKKVHVLLHSNDVIHSFFVPQARLKQDTLPGREIRAWFEITRPGVYEIPCAELCGFGHSGMKGQLTVYSDADYQKWLKEQWPPAGEQAPPAGQPPAAEAPHAGGATTGPTGPAMGAAAASRDLRPSAQPTAARAVPTRARRT